MTNKNLGIIIFSVLLAGALGFYVGSREKIKNSSLNFLANENAPSSDEKLSKEKLSKNELKAMTQEELTMNLSKIMLPDDEYNKLIDAIYQTALSLLMSQAQGLEVDNSVQNELKESIEKKYSRQYFAEINATSMKELSKSDLVNILYFYNTTEAGQKFLALSPKIIEATMTSVQSDLSQWLPGTVDNIVNKLKSLDSKPKPKKSDNKLKSKEEALFKDKSEL